VPRKSSNPAGKILLLIFVCICSLALCAQQTRAALTNADIIKMASSGFAETLIVTLIESSDTAFDVSVTGLTSLKEAGVSSKVMESMLKADVKKRQAGDGSAATTKSAPPAAMMPRASMSGMPANRNAMVQQMMASIMGAGTPGMVDMTQMPPVTLIIGETRQTMRASIAQVANTQTKGDGMPGTGTAALGMLTGLGSQALNFAAPGAGMAMGMMGGLSGMGRHGPPKVTSVWALPGMRSTVIAASSKPRFEMEYGNLLGIDPDAYEPFVVKLVQTKDNWRLVGATKSAMGQLSTEAYEKVTEVRVKSKCERMAARGQVQVVPQQALEPGEYAIVLRAIHPGKRSQGSLGGPAEQTVFFSVWDFTIQ
jgi:hypothetical protein